MSTTVFPWLIAPLVAGLMGSPHCIGMCGGFVGSVGKDVPSLLAWHMGRLTTYALLGAIAGSVGGRLPGPGWLLTLISASLLLIFSANLAGFIRLPHITVPGLTTMTIRWVRRPGLAARWIFGMLVGFLPCGLTWTALSIPMASGSGGIGALIMVAFGVGTLPLLTISAFGLHRFMSQYPWTRPGIAGFVLLAGAWALTQRGVSTQTESPPCHQEVR